MSLLLQRKEYLKKIEKIYPLSITEKKSANFDNINFKQPTLYHYRTNSEISYMFFNSSFKKNIIMESQHTDEDVSFMIFNSCPYNIVLEEHSKKNKYIFKPEHYVIGRINKNFKSFNTYIANKRYCTHYLLFKDKIFEELINQKTNQNAIFKVNGFVIDQEKTIDTKQQLILDNLPTILSLEGKLQELYLESKIIDLIYITINDIKKSASKENYKLGSKDIECLYNAKDILIKNFKNPPSLKMLAHQAAINEFKLKKGFKKLFGSTVFAFLQKYRLNEAKKILLSNEINVNEVAQMVGYKNVSHFSKIFKEYFDITPMQIKKNQKKIYI